MSLDFGWIFPSDWLSGMLLFTSPFPSLRVPRYTALPAGQSRVLRRRINEMTEIPKHSKNDQKTRENVHFFMKMAVWLLRPTIPATSSESYIIDLLLLLFYFNLIFNFKLIFAGKI